MCITIKDSFDITSIAKEKKDLTEKIVNGETRNGQELYKISYRTKAIIEEVTCRIQYKDNCIGAKVMNGENHVFFISQNECNIDLLHEATMTHKILSKSFWSTKLYVHSSISYSNSDSHFLEN